MRKILNGSFKMMKGFLSLLLVATTVAFPTSVQADEILPTGFDGSFIASGYSNPAIIENLIVETAETNPTRYQFGDFLIPTQVVRVRFTVSDLDTMEDLQRITLKFFYDDTHNPEDPESDLTQSFIFGSDETDIPNATDDVGTTFVWQWQKSIDGNDEVVALSDIIWESDDQFSTWEVIAENTDQMNENDLSYEFVVDFKISKIAKLAENRKWHVAVEVEDKAKYLSPTTTTITGEKDFALAHSFSMTWYGEIIVPEEPVAFGRIDVRYSAQRQYNHNSDVINDVTYISNGPFHQHIGSDNWIGQVIGDDPETNNGIEPTPEANGLTGDNDDIVYGPIQGPSIPNFINHGHHVAQLVTNDSSMTMNQFALRANTTDNWESNFNQVVKNDTTVYETSLVATSEAGLKVDVHLFLKVAEDFQNGYYQGSIELKITDPYFAASEQSTSVATVNGQEYLSLQEAYDALKTSGSNDTIYLLRRIDASEFIIDTPLTIDFNGHDIRGDIRIREEAVNGDTMVVRLLGEGRLLPNPSNSTTGRLTIDGRYQDIEVINELRYIAGQTIILEVSDNSFITSAIHAGNIIMNGPGRVETKDLAVDANIIINTDDEVILDGRFNTVTLNTADTRVVLDADIMTLTVNHSGVMIFKQGSSILYPINVASSRILTMVTHQYATLSNDVNYNISTSFNAVAGLIKNVTKNTYANTIAQAVASASDNDVLQLQPVQFKEAVTIDKSVSILGPNQSIAGTASRSLEARIVTPRHFTSGNSNLMISADGVIIDGVSIGRVNSFSRNHSYYSGTEHHGLRSSANHTSIINTVFTNPSDNSSVAIRVTSSSNIVGTIIENNRITGGDSGVIINNAAHTIKFNTFYGSGTSNQAALKIDGSSSTIQNKDKSNNNISNTISNNEFDISSSIIAISRSTGNVDNYLINLLNANTFPTNFLVNGAGASGTTIRNYPIRIAAQQYTYSNTQLQTAINDANDNALIEIDNTSINPLNGIVINKPLTIRPTHAGLVTFESTITNYTNPLLSINSDDVTIERIRFYKSNITSTMDAMVTVNGSNVSIVDSEFVSVDLGQFGSASITNAIVVAPSAPRSNISITGTTFSGLASRPFTNAIKLTDSTNNSSSTGTLDAITITNNTINNSTRSLYVLEFGDQTISGLTTNLTYPITSLVINQSSQTITDQTNFTFTTTIKPSLLSGSTVTWSSTNTNVATVSASGQVSANTFGQTTINASAGGITIPRLVTVTKIPVSSISLNQSSVTLNMGETTTLATTIAPTNANYTGVTYTSSNTNVATVSASGVITPVAAGSTTITVRSNDDTSKTATTSVTVTNLATAISINDPGSLTRPDGTSLQLTTSLTPSNATNTNLTWSSSNDAYASVDQNGFVTFKDSGVNVTITVTTDNGKSASVTFTLTGIQIG